MDDAMREFYEKCQEVKHKVTPAIEGVQAQHLIPVLCELLGYMAAMSHIQFNVSAKEIIDDMVADISDAAEYTIKKAAN